MYPSNLTDSSSGNVMNSIQESEKEIPHRHDSILPMLLRKEENCTCLNKKEEREQVDMTELSKKKRMRSEKVSLCRCMR